MSDRLLAIPAIGTSACLGLIGAVSLIGAPAQAICLTGGLNTAGNTCTTFNNSGTSTATLLFTDPGLNGDQHLQIGFGSQNLGSTPPPTSASGFSVTNIEYSLDNITFLPFGSGSASQAISNNGASSFTALYSSILSLSQPLPSSNTNLYVRYTLPSTITTNGQEIGVYLRSNVNNAINASPNNADASGTPLLSTAAGDGGTLLTRSNTLDLSTPPPASDVPGPLPLLGGAAAFGFSRRLRRRTARKA